jgi:hypothetical protein
MKKIGNLIVFKNSKRILIKKNKNFYNNKMDEDNEIKIKASNFVM